MTDEIEKIFTKLKDFYLKQILIFWTFRWKKKWSWFSQKY